MAGVDWLCGFLQIRPDMSLRKKTITAAARAMGFSKAAPKLFNLLSNAINEYRVTPDKIFIVGETNITVNPKGKPRVSCTKTWKSSLCS
jgi:fatty acid-binding protein DegV